MFSSRLRKMCFFITNLGHRYGSFLLKFDKKSQRFYTSNDPNTFRKVQLNYNLLVFWLLATFFQLMKHKFHGDFNQYILTLAYTVGEVTFVLMFSILRWCHDDTCLLLNRYTTFYKFFQVKFLPHFDPDKSQLNIWIDVFVFCYSLGCFNMAILITLYCLYDPRASAFMGAHIPIQHYSYIPTALVSTFLHGHIMIALEINIAFTGSIVIVYLFYLTVTLTKELKVNNSWYMTSDQLRTPQNLRLVYRSFQILNENAMCFIGPFITLFHGVFVLLPIVCNCILIRYWSELELISKLPLLVGCWLVTVFWMLVLQLGKYLWVRGNAILCSWKRSDWNGNKLEIKIMRKFSRSCRPILIFHGKQLVIGRMTQFFYFKAVTRGIFRSLLTTRK